MPKNKGKKLYLTDSNGELIKKCQQALLEIFARYDVDKDGALNNEELDNFAKGCNNGSVFSADEKQQLRDTFDHNSTGNLTSTGFLEMYSLQTMSEPTETWKDLAVHGYNRALELEEQKKEQE